VEADKERIEIELGEAYLGQWRMLSLERCDSSELRSTLMPSFFVAIASTDAEL
jgi:hypothetical protein